MKRPVHILLAFCILNMVYGCITTRELPVLLADIYSKDFDYITIHTTNMIFELHEFKFSNHTLEGIITDQQEKNSKTFNIYVDNEIDASPSKYVVIERRDIKKVTYVTRNVPEAIPASIVIILFIALMVTASKAIVF